MDSMVQTAAMQASLLAGATLTTGQLVPDRDGLTYLLLGTASNIGTFFAVDVTNIGMCAL